MADSPNDTGLKRCSCCKRRLPRTDFSRNKSRADGLSSLCRKCDAATGNKRRLARYYLNKEKAIADSARWRKAHPEKMRRYTAKWLAANIEKVREYQNSEHGKDVRRRAMAKYRASEHGKAAATAYRLRNKEAARARMAAWRAANPERNRESDRRNKTTEKGRLTGRIISHRRRARKAEIPGTYSSADIAKLLERSDRCYLCGKRFTKRQPATVDHVIPIASALGSNDPGNLALAHKSCNSKKRDLRVNPISGQGLLL